MVVQIESGFVLEDINPIIDLLLGYLLANQDEDCVKVALDCDHDGAIVIEPIGTFFGSQDRAHVVRNQVLVHHSNNQLDILVDMFKEVGVIVSTYDVDGCPWTKSPRGNQSINFRGEESRFNYPKKALVLHGKRGDDSIVMVKQCLTVDVKSSFQQVSTCFSSFHWSGGNDGNVWFVK